MAKIAKLIGGAGTGKTTELLRIMCAALERLEGGPERVGFVSFTRAARSEAASRAAKQFGIEAKQLEQFGWFRTLHSICWRCTAEDRGPDKLLTDNAEGHRWITERLGSDAEWSSESDLAFASAINRDDVVQFSLALWNFSRHRLQTLQDAFSRVAALGGSSGPKFDWDAVAGVVRKYEGEKRADDRIDFTDLMLRFTGIRCDPDGGLYEMEPQGYVPLLPVWFLDEWQDSSPLMNRVARRLIEAPGVEYVYVAGDPYQAIYSFTGSDPRYFREMKADRERVMPQSYRCPPCVHEYGEEILRQSGDYWDRGIAPASHAGEIGRRRLCDALAEVRSGESWLVLARTNAQASDLAKRLHKMGCVWKPTRGVGGWEAPKKRIAMFALADMARDNAPISGDEWNTILDYLPSQVKGTKEPLLVRGTKAKWLDKDYARAQRSALARAARQNADEADISDWGATPLLQHLIRSGEWARLLDDGEQWAKAIRDLPYAAVANPSIRVGTIHSVKGEEADNVLVYTGWCQPARVAAAADIEARDEEIRLCYVASTRARKRLLIADSPADKPRGNQMPFPELAPAATRRVLDEVSA